MIISKQTKIIKKSDLENGLVLLIDKNKSRTSFDVVWEVRKKFGIKKVGHAGTLDPMATGLLIVCLGKKTKEIYKFQNMIKVYTGTISLGKKTSSMDAETEVIKERPLLNITEQKLNEVKNLFVGEIEQIPPMYSALKHKGKSLYKYARKGIEIEREPRKINVYEFDIQKVNLPDLNFKIKCSKGTYIRVIANDFGEKLECGGYLTKLRRTEIGEFNVDDALTIDELGQIQIIEGN
jgi:tRNA pseudouridine55 synthase